MTALGAITSAEMSAPPQMHVQPGAPEPGWPPRLSPRMLVSLLPSALANIVAPALAYTLIRPHVASSTVALLAVTAIPACWTLATFAWRRRADRIGMLSVVVSVIALAVSYLTGHSPLALELQDPVETGAIGLACFVSVVARRPLWLMALRMLARRNSHAARMLADPAIRRTATVETAIIGAILLVHAITITILALTLSTGMFVAVNRLVGLPILAVGLTVLIWYRRSRRKQTRPDMSPQGGGSGDDQAS